MRILLCLGALLSFTQLSSAAGDPQLPALIKTLDGNDELARYRALVSLAELGPKAEPAIDALIKVLKLWNENESLMAAIALGKIGKPAVKPLGELLNHPSEDVRYFAVWSLGLIGPDAKEATKHVLVLATDKNDSVRRKAVYTLGRIDADPTMALPPLANCLEDPSPLVSRTASESMARFGEKAVPHLIAALKKEPTSVRSEAIFALGLIGPDAKDAVPELKVFFFKDESILSLNAAQTLAKIGKAALPALIEGMHHSDERVRSAAINVMPQLGAEAVQPLIDALSSERAGVRQLAALRLGNMRIPERSVVLALGFVLGDNEQQVRLNAANSLSLLGPAAAPAVPNLIAALKNSPDIVRTRCVNVLGNIGPGARAAVPELKNLLMNDLKLSASAGQSLGRIGKEAMPALLEVFKSDNPLARKNALSGLALIGSETKPMLLTGLTDKDVEVRRIAALRLSALRLTEKSEVLALADALKDFDNTVRTNAALGLQNAGVAAAPAMSQLMAGLKDDVIFVRSRCATALGNIGPAAKAAIPTLTELLTDANVTVRNAAKNALAKIEKG